PEISFCPFDELSVSLGQGHGCRQVELVPASPFKVDGVTIHEVSNVLTKDAARHQRRPGGPARLQGSNKVHTAQPRRQCKLQLAQLLFPDMSEPRVLPMPVHHLTVEVARQS